MTDHFGGTTALGWGPYGAPHPPIGNLFGAQFTNSAYSLGVAGLAPGAYLFAVYPYSTVSKNFVGPATTTLTIKGGSDPRMSIDSPAAGTSTSQPFNVYGWAIDLGASSGTGIGGVYGYAVPAGGGAAIPLGWGPYGAPHPPIGEIFGAQFTNSAYSLRVAGLAPGAYLIAVYPYSTVSRSFVGPVTRSLVVR